MGKKLPSRTLPTPMTAGERAFVEDATASVPQGTKPSGHRAPPPRRTAAVAGRNLVPRADGRAMRRIAAYFTPALAKRLELHCVQTDRDLSAVIVQAVEQHLKAAGH